MHENERQLTVSGMASLIRERRTVRVFDSRPIETLLLLELLQAAADAQALDTEPPCRFVLVASHEGKSKAAALIIGTYTEQKLYKWVPDQIGRLMINRTVQIPAYLLAILKSPDDAQTGERDFAAVCAMLHNFSLLAWERGIGLVWNTDPLMHKPSFASGMGLQADERVVSMLYMGYFAKAPKPRPRTPAAKKLTYL